MTSDQRTTDGRRLAADAGRIEALRAEAAGLAALTLEPRQIDDLELLLGGALAPLTGFATEAEHEVALQAGRCPLSLDVAPSVEAAPGDRIGLRDREGALLAIVSVTSRFVPDRQAQAARLVGPDGHGLPAARRILDLEDRVCLGGPVEGVMLPRHEWFRAFRAPAVEVAAAGRGSTVIAIPADGPLHRQQLEQCAAAARRLQARLLVMVLVGEPPRARPDPGALVRALAAWTAHAGEDARMVLVPYAPRWLGAAEAGDLARLARNHGATHLLLGGDLGAPRGPDGEGLAGTDLDAAQAAVRDEGLEPLPCPRWSYDAGRGRFVAADEPDAPVPQWSEGALRAALEQGVEPPEWVTFPAVLEALRQAWPPRARQGFVVLFTGLSGSGKSTLATKLDARLAERGGRRVTLLDGDEVREHLSSGLGFSREDRDLNVRRIGYVAAEIARHGGAVICAPIAPYARTRRWVRERIESHAIFVEVHVSTPIAVCEARDPKGLYARARRGEIESFTGIDDPYEAPEHAEIVIDTSEVDADAAVHRVVEHLAGAGLI